MKIPTEIINEIADNLEMGLTCYFNKDTSQLIAIPGEIEMYLDEGDDELFEFEAWYEDAKIIRASQIVLFRLRQYLQMNLSGSWRILLKR